MSRNNEFFHACKVDNWYIFEHTEYEWDDIEACMPTKTPESNG